MKKRGIHDDQRDLQDLHFPIKLDVKRVIWMACAASKAFEIRKAHRGIVEQACLFPIPPCLRHVESQIMLSPTAYATSKSIFQPLLFDHQLCRIVQGIIAGMKTNFMAAILKVMQALSHQG